MNLTDEQLATVIKAVSIRKQNLYAALRQSTPDTDKWRSIDAQIEPIEEVDKVLEAERNHRRERANAETAA